MALWYELLSKCLILPSNLMTLLSIADCPLRGKWIKLPQIHHQDRPDALLNVESKHPFAI